MKILPFMNSPKPLTAPDGVKILGNRVLLEVITQKNNLIIIPENVKSQVHEFFVVLRGDGPNISPLLVPGVKVEVTQMGSLPLVDARTNPMRKFAVFSSEDIIAITPPQVGNPQMVQKPSDTN